MYRFRLSHILLCGLISPFFVTSLAATQNGDPAAQPLSPPYQKWLDEDVRYLITDTERTEFGALKTDQQRDKFVEEFWERRNPSPGSADNKFKEEHYRRLAYTNQHFAAGVAGYKSDRGRIYILYGPPDEREQHPGSADAGIPDDAPLRVRYPSDVWRYHILNGVGRDVVFEFIDHCRCGEYQLQEDLSKRRLPSPRRKEKPLRIASLPIWPKWLNEDVPYIITDEERADFNKLHTDEQLDKFIEDFWEPRNPNHGSAENTFKEEHYRRIAYTNQHFATNVPGWRTDRGRTYIRYGPPNQIDQHFSAAGSKKASDLFGVGAIPYDWELWHYHYIEGLGEDVTLEFVDTCGCGRFEMPVTKEDLNRYKPR
jgi:GWxTD domain-containing protein